MDSRRIGAGCRNLTVTDRLVGFCLLFRREVMNRIGLLDEQFEVGCFEDDDFCRRARLVGYRAIIANHVFIHHFGSVTFEGAGFDLHDILIQNERKYEEKWAQLGGVATSFPAATGTAPDAADAYSGYQLHRLSGGSALLQRRLIRLSLCMIVRDNEETIEACLDSIYPWVDEIIIVDTGSRDRTPEICRRFGARMFDFPWCDDFSAARNVSVEPAPGNGSSGWTRTTSLTRSRGRSCGSWFTVLTLMTVSVMSCRFTVCRMNQARSP
ncbi:MAG UNVERIFIED_CONTAM: glycosyltransferase [Planctomycetaceae bacterium]